MKTVKVEAELVGSFKVESQIGDHTLYIDQPKELGGEGTGPNPLQYFLLSLGGCICAISRIAANQKKIELRSIKLAVQGELDPDVFMGKNKENRAGFESISIEAEIDADLSAEEKKAFMEEVESRCPVADNLLKVTPVTLSLKD
jgi:uncharacterized OsmC-like protein